MYISYNHVSFVVVLLFTDPAPNKMFVGGLSWQTTPEKLREYFGAYGTVRDVLIMKDPVTQVRILFFFLVYSKIL